LKNVAGVRRNENVGDNKKVRYQLHSKGKEKEKNKSRARLLEPGSTARNAREDKNYEGRRPKEGLIKKGEKG